MVVELNGQPSAVGSGLLYHYASVATFDAILASGEMWLSDYRVLSDESEISFGRAVAERTFSSFGESSVFRELLTNCLAASRNEEFFVASFSLEADCLNQWRAYGDGCRGVSIGLGMSEFITLIECDPQAVSLSCVTYDADTQALLFSTVATLARQIFELDEARGKHEPAILVRELQRTISELLPLCKDRAWTDERECRLIVVPCLTLSGATSGMSLRHRQGVYGDVGYISTRDVDRNFELPVQAVITGPWISRTDLDRVRGAANAHSLDLRHSEVPLRLLPR